MTSHQRVEPDTRRLLAPGLEVLCFGAGNDWGIRDPTPEGADAANPGLLARLVAAMSCDGWSGKVYMPHPGKFNALVGYPEWYTPWHAESGIEIVRGTDADGTVLSKPGEAFAISSADCPTAIFWDPHDPQGPVCAAHAGRDSLIDRARYMPYGRNTRPNDGVIHPMICEFRPEHRSRLHGFVACGIGPEHFTHPTSHPEHGRQNLRMCFDIVFRWGGWCVPGDNKDDGRIDLVALIRAQAREELYGLDPGNIGHDGVDTYGDLREDGQHRWHSCRRGSRGRNLTILRRF